MNPEFLLMRKLPYTPKGVLTLPFKAKLDKESFLALANCLGMRPTHLFYGAFGSDLIWLNMAEGRLIEIFAKSYNRFTLDGIDCVNESETFIPPDYCAYPYGNAITFAHVQGTVIMKSLTIKWLT